MNTRQQIHQIKLQQWMELFQNQKASGLTVKAWCAENDISIHTYNYWKHQLKEEYVASSLPDIVSVSPNLLPSISNNSTSRTSNLPTLSNHSSDSLDSLDTNSICISCGDIQLSVGSSVSEEHLLRILKAVRYA